jgi:hypothetical protein
MNKTTWNIETPIIAQIIADHQNLCAMLGKLQKLFVSYPTETNLPELCQQVLPELYTLRTTLTDHFRREEAGGFMEEAVCKRPGIGQAADKIVQEHPVLLKKLDEVIDLLTNKTKLSLATWHDAHAKFIDFVKHQHQHEHCETEVLQQGFNEDLRGIDE